MKGGNIVDINYDKLLRSVVKKKNSVCPMCCSDNCKPWFNILPNTWIGKHDSLDHPLRSKLRFWEKKRRWRMLRFKCMDCGNIWWSEPFPDDLHAEVMRRYRESTAQ